MKQTDSIFREALETAFHHSLAYLQTLNDGPVAATADLHSLRRHLGRPLADAGIAPAQVISDLAEDVAGGILGSPNGRFFGWVIGGALPGALAADWMTSIWDQNAALYACAPAAAVVEEIVGVWLKELLALPSSASFALVSGCQMAHVTCLAAARHSLLAKHGWNVEEQGLFGAPRVRILTSSERHGSFERAVRLLGFGSQNVTALPIDTQGRLEFEALEEALTRGSSIPSIVLLQAGDINLGAFDEFERLIPLAQRHGAWVHVDGAFGLWAAASPQRRHLVRGMAEADSWATDGHKWLNVPYDCGYAFVADAASHRAALSHRASYLTHADEARDQLDWNPEWSRRARGFPTYAALRELGREGVAELIERCCRHAYDLVAGIGQLPGTEVLWEPTLNQGLVRFPGSQASEEDRNRRTDEVIAQILLTGDAFFSGTTWRGKRAMRISVCNWRTSDDDVERALRAVASALQQATDK